MSFPVLEVFLFVLFSPFLWLNFHLLSVAILKNMLDLKLLSELEKVVAEIDAHERIALKKKPVKIRPKDTKCPKCKKPWKLTPNGYLCLKCLTVPKRYYLDLSWQGKRCPIFVDRQGVTLSSWEQAKRVAAIVETEILEHRFDPSKWRKVDRKRFVFKNLVYQYLDERKKVMTPAGFQAKQSWFKKIVSFFGSEDVRDIRGYHVQDFVNSLLDDGLSANSVKKVLVELRAFLNWCAKQELIEKVPPMPEIKTSQKARRYLSPEQQLRILECIPDEHKPIFEFGMLTGLRPGELRAIMWDAVDLDNGFVYIKRAFSLDKLVEFPKEKKPKIIPLVGRLREIIEEQARNRKGLFVFSYQHRKRSIPYPQKRLWKIFKDALQKSGLPEDVTLYETFRHSFVMQRLKQGFSYEQVGAAVGHSSPTTTRLYARLQTEQVQDVFEAAVVEFSRKKKTADNRE